VHTPCLDDGELELFLGGNNSWACCGGAPVSRTADWKVGLCPIAQTAEWVRQVLCAPAYFTVCIGALLSDGGAGHGGARASWSAGKRVPRGRGAGGRCSAASAPGGSPLGAVTTAQLPRLSSHEGPFSLPAKEEGRTLALWGFPLRAEEEGLWDIAAGGGIWTARWCRPGGGVSGIRTPRRSVLYRGALFVSLGDAEPYGHAPHDPGASRELRRGWAWP